MLKTSDSLIAGSLEVAVDLDRDQGTLSKIYYLFLNIKLKVRFLFENAIAVLTKGVIKVNRAPAKHTVKRRIECLCYLLT